MSDGDKSPAENKAEKGRVVDIFSRVVRESYTEKGMFEQSHDGSNGLSHVDIEIIASASVLRWECAWHVLIQSSEKTNVTGAERAGRVVGTEAERCRPDRQSR